jgi:GNAT superfamily N-acetyltransferase
LRSPNQRYVELNEVRWWSHWARLSWFGSSGYLLTSQDLPEPFFNRAGTLTCRGVEQLAMWSEKKLAARGVDSTVLVFDSCVRAASTLLDSGYKQVDTMTVLLSASPIVTDSSVQLRITMPSSAEIWTRAYLRAFYGDENLAASVVPIVSRLLRAKTITLLEAKVDEKTAGVMAISRTRGLAGVYCAGVVPQYRSKGVASGLFIRAKEIAYAEGRELILQTLASDRAESFYSRRGFVKLYSKRMLSKESSNAVKNPRS